MMALKGVVQSIWQRIPETVRVLGVLAVILDLVAVPSVVVVVQAAGHPTAMPWTAWALLAQHATWRHTYGLVAVALLGGAGYWGWTLSKDGTGAAGHNRHAFGSATWRTTKDLTRSLAAWHWGARRGNPAGLVAGTTSTKGPVRSAWILDRDGHNLLVGAPGAGKSLKVILPSLAVIAEAGENLVITDPKGELKQAMGGYLVDQGYNVLTFDLRFPDQSVTWNPLTPITQAIEAGRWSEATKMANDLANIVASQGAPGGDNGAFWAQSARAIGAALALYVADQAPPAARHVTTMYQVLTQAAGQLDALMTALPLDHPARQAYGPLLTGSAETRQNQMSVVAVSLSLFADRNIARLTGTSELDPATLLAPRTALFIVVPDDSSTYYPLVALFVTQLLQQLASDSARQPGGRLKVPVHMVLDEFGNLPKIPDFEKAITVSRGRGIHVTLTLQAFSQLESVYGQSAARTMINSCNTLVYLSSNEVETARIVSDKAGQTTIETTSRGQSWQSGSRQWSENANFTGRALLTPDEVLRWRSDHALVLQAGELPAKLPLRFWKDWPQAQQARTLPPPLKMAERPNALPPIWTPEVVEPTVAGADALTVDPEALIDPWAAKSWQAPGTRKAAPGA